MSSLPNMTGYNEFIAASSKGVQLEHINIGGSDNPVRLIETLNRLGLMEDRMVAPLQTIAAAGKSPVNEFYTIDTLTLDRRLHSVAASPEQKIALKAGLARAGILVQTRG